MAQSQPAQDTGMIWPVLAPRNSRLTARQFEVYL